MSDFKKLIKLTWKRFSIWLILLCMFFSIINSLFARSQIKYYSIGLRDCVYEMEKEIGNERYKSNSLKIDSDYLKYADQVAKKFADKYDLDYDYDNFDMKNQQRAENNGRITEYLTLRDYQYRIESSIKEGKFDVSGIYQSLIFFVLIAIVIFSIATTSLEESMAYYDFTRMFPWKKEKELLMKVAAAFLFGMVVFAINTLATSIMLKSSDLGLILSFRDFPIFLLKSLVIFLLASIISTSLGLLAGNILGHMGLLFIIIAGFELVELLINTFISVFSTSLALKFSNIYEKTIEGLNPFAKVFVSLTYFDYYKNMAFLAALIIGLIVGIVAFIITKSSSAERSGYMVKNTAISFVCKMLAVFTLTSLFYVFFSGIADLNILIVQIVVYLLSFLLSYKFFDILFNIRLKF